MPRNKLNTSAQCLTIKVCRIATGLLFMKGLRKSYTDMAAAISVTIPFSFIWGGSREPAI